MNPNPRFRAVDLFSRGRLQYHRDRRLEKLKVILPRIHRAGGTTNVSAWRNVVNPVLGEVGHSPCERNKLLPMHRNAASENLLEETDPVSVGFVLEWDRETPNGPVLRQKRQDREMQPA